MGFYLRKSISVGPLRFNLSKSGVGVSTGIKGLRVGIGPRGNYVHMGRHGLYYRATLPSTASQGEDHHSINRNLAQDVQIPDGTHAPLVEIESADISKIVESSSRELLDEIKNKNSKIRIWPIAACVSAGIALLTFNLGLPTWLVIAIATICVVGVYITYIRDSLNKTVVLFYDFDSEMEAAYQELHSAATKLSGCSCAWHIEASGKVYDRKYHAGASDLVRRKRTMIFRGSPPYLKTNIETVAIGVGRQTLHFFPDRILIYDQSGVGSVNYKELNLDVSATQFIESEAVPRDAKVIGRTWKYVNKSGGPDKRFKDNIQLPICQYEEISLRTASGLNEVIQISRTGLGGLFAGAITTLGKKMPNER
ncbi:MAG: DUF4236 domain-containing protein [Pseudomonadota bacterium]|nr:DUF4236 domain-containing protein [Pseudomonadota bacterium]